ncbi:MAG: AAA family ATPase [Clostridiales bacterium]|nr:AAA family ATPase [Clostridiales bacterium]
MSAGNEFLKVVVERLRIRLEEVRRTIEEVKEDIRGMNDYYWDNYTEMDEYGYENYDNQQALKLQADANEENRRYRRRLEKMLDAPFFGSVSFRFDDDGEDAEPETFYIGIGNFANRAGEVPLIYDWRAPVSSLFYDYEQGPASYEAPDGAISGEITSRAQYKIRGGKMIYEFENDLKIDDEILKEELGKNSDVRLKNIIRTIQKEQNAVIRNTKDRVLVIQGAAGSGKTSIALHRIAYLLYHDRERLNSSNILILSPNSVFSDYISQILPELGEENIREMNLDLFAYHELKSIAEDCEDVYDHTERMIRLQKTDPKVWEEAERECRYRQSEQFVRDVEGFLIELEDRIVDFEDISFKKWTMAGDEIQKLFYEKFAETPILSRMDAVRERFVDEYETLYGDLSEEENLLIKSRFDSLYVTTDLYKIYQWFLESQGLQGAAQLPPEERKLPYPDVYPLLYLKYRLWATPARREVRHLVIDEMQDYSYLQYVILQILFPCPKTILGDRAQTIRGEGDLSAGESEVQTGNKHSSSKMNGESDMLKYLPRILGRDTRVLEMKKSYRNTLEIAAYAAGIRPLGDIEYFERHGKPVEEIRLQSEDVDSFCKDITSHVNLSEDGFETAAVLALAEDEARLIYETMKKYRDDVHYVDRDSRSFQKGITVTAWYLAKGLEFDQVFVAKADPTLPYERQYRYICATRALHELYVYY